jgi:gluconate 2-dehydrogenase gamma chain
MKHPASKDPHQPLLSLNRRDFVGLLAAAAAACPLAVLAEQRRQPAAADQQHLAEPWRTLDAVQQHLFPAADESPGARDINALGYLRNMLQAPDMDDEERRFISQGVGWLNDIAGKQKSAAFVALDQADREQVLRSIEQSRAGERWLSTLLSYLLEALLSDPVYGGNPDGIGWQWLEYQPGFPTPPKEKMYYKLALNRSYRRTRA